MLLALVLAPGARADRMLVEGEQSASFLLYDVPEAVAPGDYENNGFVQKVRHRADVYRVDVHVELSPLESRAAFPPHGDDLPLDAWAALLPTAEAPTDDPRILELAVDILADARTQYEAVTRVVDWVSTHVEYVVDTELPTSARETLDRRKAYCVGMANLAVSLLRTAGIPARDVHGILAQRKEALSGNPIAFTSSELHRWLEVYISDIGWVFSDPLRSSHFADAYHVVLYPHEPGDGYDPELFRGARLRLLAERDGAYGVDRALDEGRRVRVRPNMAGRFSAAVVGVARLADGSPLERGVAVLSGGGATRRTPLGRGGKFSFTGVATGVYQLRVLSEGLAVNEQSFRIANRELKRVSVTMGGP